MQVELKNVKYNERLSKDSNCYSATVYIDGIRTAEAANHGNGGPDDYRVLNPQKWTAFQKWATTLPPEKQYNLPMTAELYIGDLLDRYLHKQQLARYCRKETLFRLKGDPDDDSYRTVKAKFSPEVKAFLQRKYGDKLAVIANETL